MTEIQLKGRLRSIGRLAESGSQQEPSRRGSLLTFSVLTTDRIAADVQALLSQSVTVRLARANGHPEPLQSSLPLPVDEAPKPESQVITIPGQPVGKPTMTARDRFLVGERARPCVARYRSFCDRARAAAKGKIPKEVEEISVRAYFAMPDSWPHEKKLQHDGRRNFQKPDMSNVVKAVEDALLENDEIIAKIDAEKFWTLNNPRTEVWFS